jgi:hypothetical protein
LSHAGLGAAAGGDGRLTADQRELFGLVASVPIDLSITKF